MTTTPIALMDPALVALAALLVDGGVRHDPRAQCMTVVLGDQRWSFDPRRAGSLFEPGAHPSPAATLRLPGGALLGACSDPQALLVDGAQLEGDENALLAWIRALADRPSRYALRTKAALP